jgi:hypothetical protein
MIVDALLPPRMRDKRMNVEDYNDLLEEVVTGSGDPSLIEANAAPLFWGTLLVLIFVVWPLSTLIRRQLIYRRLKAALSPGYYQAAAYAHASKGIAIDRSGSRFAFALRRRVHICAIVDILRVDYAFEQQGAVMALTVETRSPVVPRFVLQSVFRQSRMGSVAARLKALVIESRPSDALKSDMPEELTLAVRELSDAIRSLTDYLRKPGEHATLKAD